MFKFWKYIQSAKMAVSFHSSVFQTEFYDYSGRNNDHFGISFNL